MSRVELAELVSAGLPYSIPAAVIGGYERGDTHWPAKDRRDRLCVVFGVAGPDKLGFYTPGSGLSAHAGGPENLGLTAESTALAPWSWPGPSRLDVAVADGPVALLDRVDEVIAQTTIVRLGDDGFERLVEELIDWAQRSGRRDFLGLLSASAAAAAIAPVLHGLDDDERTRTARALIEPERLDLRVVSNIEAVLWNCMIEDDLVGPRAALDTVLSQRALVREILRSVQDKAIRQSVLTLYANLSRFAGWLAFDLGNNAAATQYYEAAREDAHQAQNPALGAFVLCNLSHLATWREQPRVGIDHALAAESWANRTNDTQLRAYALDVSARALALDGQGAAAMYALERAESLLCSAQQPSPLVYFFNVGQLHSTRAMCQLSLGANADSAAEAQKALECIDPSFVRNLALTKLHEGLAHLRLSPGPDVPAGAEALTEAGALAGRNGSARLAQAMRDGYKELSAFRRVPSARTALDRLVAYAPA